MEPAKKKNFEGSLQPPKM